MKPKLFALLERRFREMFNVKPDIELCDDLVWRLFENQMDNIGIIPPEAWEYMQATFDRAVEETNLFENLWSNL